MWIFMLFSSYRIIFIALLLSAVLFFSSDYLAAAI
jgi:hypothetical protein